MIMNLNTEIRRGYTITADMKQLWGVEMELLNKLLEVCNRYHLKIWAEGGTLLGAVREHGFIPWDDDIDMAMLRDDYEKLIAISKQEFTAPYFFQCGYTERKYPRGHAQLRKDGTAAILKRNEFCSFHQGIFIDIFVYDVIPDDINELSKLKDSVSKKRSELSYYCNKRFSVFHPLYSLKLLCFKLPIWIKGSYNLFQSFDSLLKGHNGDDVACIGFLWDLEHYRRKISLYDDTEYVPFEDILIPIPSGYDTILTTQYGDYMKPTKAPTYHGGFAIVDTKKSYKEYLPMLRRRARKEIMRKRFSRIKLLFGA